MAGNDSFSRRNRSFETLQEELAQQVLHDCTSDDVDIDASALAGDLLPDWYEDWVMFERERFRQLRLAALDVLCERLTRAGRLRDALDVGLVVGGR